MPKPTTHKPPQAQGRTTPRKRTDAPKAQVSSKPSSKQNYSGEAFGSFLGAAP